MKRIRFLLCFLVCIFCLTACNTQTRKSLDPEMATTLEQTTGSLVTEFLVALNEEQSADIVSQGHEYLEYVVTNYFGVKAEGNGLVSALNSWNSAKADLGEFVSVTGMNAAYDDSDRNIIVTLDVVGTKRTAQIEAIYKDDLYKTLTSLTTNINWTFGEKMEKAGLNTLLGMGTVFCVLIIISILISMFNFIPKIQKAFSKEDKADVKAQAVDNTIAQIVEKEEQEEDDLEIVAVITAAIAAASAGGGGSGSSDDFVVRSIVRRSNSVWNR